MRLRVIHRIDASARQGSEQAADRDPAQTGERRPPREQASLWPVGDPKEAVEASELWVGVHVPFAPTSTSGSTSPQATGLPGMAGSVPGLEQLAVHAQHFTPRVSLVPPDGVLLEVKGSLHLFKGPRGLLRALAGEYNTLGVRPALAMAPTPLAAMVAARLGKPTDAAAGARGPAFIVTDKGQLIGRLASLPLAPLRWPEDILERLAWMGVRTIGQALRLPRAGFARRFGAAQLAELDRLTGRSADPRRRFEARARFRRRRVLTCELESSEGILAALAPVLAELGKFLQARQCGLMRLECLLGHRHSPPSRCLLGLASPVAEVSRLTELLGERLSALVLPEPVRFCELRSGPLVTRVLASSPLWQPGQQGSGGGAESVELLERLRARLGPEAVYGLRVLCGHRPESAWGVAEPGDSQLRGSRVRPAAGCQPPWPAFRRPLWLLRVPELLEESDGLPRRKGFLRLSGDVERIETGWWDGGDIGRDYYTACDLQGVQLWVFRERAAPHRWFLHGVFG